MPSKILKKVEFTLADGGFSPASERIVRETDLTVNVNGRHFATAMVLANLEKEFVIGNLYTQGIIRAAADIASRTLPGPKTTLVAVAKSKRIGRVPTGITRE